MNWDFSPFCNQRLTGQTQSDRRYLVVLGSLRSHYFNWLTSRTLMVLEVLGLCV